MWAQLRFKKQLISSIPAAFFLFFFFIQDFIETMKFKSKYLIESKNDVFKWHLKVQKSNSYRVFVGLFAGTEHCVGVRSFKGMGVCSKQKWICITLENKRTRWHLTKTSPVGVFVASLKGPLGWLRDETLRGHHRPHFHMHALSMSINRTVHECRHTCTVTRTLLPKQSYDDPQSPCCSLAAGQRVSQLAQPATQSCLFCLSGGLFICQPSVFDCRSV